MGWTRPDPALVTARDRVRYKIGDIDPITPRVEDETIDALLIMSDGNELDTAISLVRHLLAKFAETASTVTNSLEWQSSDIFTHYTLLLEQLYDEVGQDARPYAGGLTYSDKAANDANSDRVAPFFKRDENRVPFMDDRRLLG